MRGAIVRLPAILLLDEATAALDYADRDLVFGHAPGPNIRGAFQRIGLAIVQVD